MTTATTSPTAHRIDGEAIDGVPPYTISALRYHLWRISQHPDRKTATLVHRIPVRDPDRHPDHLLDDDSDEVTRYALWTSRAAANRAARQEKRRTAKRHSVRECRGECPICWRITQRCAGCGTDDTRDPDRQNNDDQDERRPVNCARCRRRNRRTTRAQKRRTAHKMLEIADRFDSIDELRRHLQATL